MIPALFTKMSRRPNLFSIPEKSPNIPESTTYSYDRIFSPPFHNYFHAAACENALRDSHKCLLHLM